ncbi:HAD family phosphatase [Bacillus sp. A301a_S52]|nr:HAD family phosphatase [Bacillus sp. A301a_S52]
MRHKHHFEAVIFDIDGVLVDSEHYHHQAVNDICSEISHVISIDKSKELIGLSLEETFDQLQLRRVTTNKSEWMQKVEERYLQIIDREMERPYASELIKALKISGVKIACVTTANRKVAEANLKIIGVLESISCLITRESVANTKPDPEPYMKALHKLTVSPEHALVVEDSAIGVQAALAAHVGTVLFYPHHMSNVQDMQDPVIKINRFTDYSFFNRTLSQFVNI